MVMIKNFKMINITVMLLTEPKLNNPKFTRTRRKTSNQCEKKNTSFGHPVA